MAGGLTALPAELAPWSRELDLFPRELALDLGAIVRRIASMAGTAIPARAASGDPDGLEGLSRRGPYDRLLHSEWLLADELPDEFARRAAMHEHLFVALARRQNVQHPLSVALFDSGPSQLGTPRLVHIAALVVLARRAAAAEATFRWGVLQAPDGVLFEDVTPENVLALLEGRTYREGREEDLAAWETRIGAGQPVGELWFIGPERLARFPSVRRQWHLEVEDVLEPGKRQVRAAIRHDTRHDPAVLLELPEQGRCVRLLRDPFAAAVVPVAMRSPMHAVASNVFFDNGGRLFIGRTKEGRLLVQPYANSSKVKRVPEARLFDAGDETVVAAGWEKGSAVVVVVTPNKLVIRRLEKSKVQTIHRQPGQAFPTAGTGMERRLLPAVGTQRVRHFEAGTFFVDASGKLWSATTGNSLRPIADGVVALRSSGATITYLSRTEDGLWQVRQPHWNPADEIRRVEKAGAEAFFGFPRPYGNTNYGVVALELQGGAWLIMGSFGEQLLHPPPGCTVFGVTMVGREWGRCALLCIESDLRTVTANGPRLSKAILHAPSPIAFASASATHPHVAAVLESGDVEIVSLTSGQKMFRSQRIEEA